MPTLVYFNTPMHNATATASTLGVPIAFFGALSYLLSPTGAALPGAFGYLDVQALPGIIVGALIAAPFGVKFAHRVPASALKRAFGALLVLVSARMLWTVLG